MTKAGAKRTVGRPRAAPGELRDQIIAVNFSTREIAALAARAGGRRLRPFIRNAALGRKLPKKSPPPALAMDLAERLTAVAGDLASLAEASRGGRVLGWPPHLLDRLHDAAHVAGLLILGARPDAP